MAMRAFDRTVLVRQAAIIAGRLLRNRSLPGRHITDCQMRLYMSFRRTETPSVAAAKASGSAPPPPIVSNRIHGCRRKRKCRVAADVGGVSEVWDGKE